MKELCSNCERPAKGRWLLLESEGWTYYQKGHTVVQIDDD